MANTKTLLSAGALLLLLVILPLGAYFFMSHGASFRKNILDSMIRPVSLPTDSVVINAEHIAWSDIPEPVIVIARPESPAAQANIKRLYDKYVERFDNLKEEIVGDVTIIVDCSKYQVERVPCGKFDFDYLSNELDTVLGPSPVVLIDRHNKIRSLQSLEDEHELQTVDKQIGILVPLRKVTQPSKKIRKEL